MKSVEITPELTCHNEIVEQLGAKAFGPGRFTRTAFRLRERVPHDEVLSFVALKSDVVVGSVRVTAITIGNRDALVLGPLVVDPNLQNEGIGGKLMQECIATCKQKDHEFVILVGDEPYYKSFGFKKMPFEKVILPGPVDPHRFLYCELKSGTAVKYSGLAKPGKT